MSVEEIKSMFKSFLKAWIFSPEAILETYQEKKEIFAEDATTNLSVYRRYYKK